MKNIEKLVIIVSIFLITVTFPLSIFICLMDPINGEGLFYTECEVVKHYERAVIFRLGRLRGGAQGPGFIFIIPCTDNIRKVDLRLLTFNVPPQEILTRDSVTVEVDAVVYYRVENPLKAIICVNDYRNATNFLAATFLRNVLGTQNLSDILANRESIANILMTTLIAATDPWGIKVERVEIKDVMLPRSMQRAMAAEAEATREARAKVISAEGELKAARSLKEASEVMADNPASLQLRYLQTLNTISADRRSAVIFPVPLHLLSPFTKNEQ